MIRAALRRLIRCAIDEPDPAAANAAITCCHRRLSRALADVLGPAAGPNFHTWAVWGSLKAGATIRGEDLDAARGIDVWAVRNMGLITAIPAALIGAAAGGSWEWTVIAGLIGLVVGQAAIGLARRRSAQLILRGNKTVLIDIGHKTADFVACCQADDPARWAAFFRGFRPGRTADGGQDLLRLAFRMYYRVFRATSDMERAAACRRANCLAVWHEHIRLQPLIAGSMPVGLRRWATRRLLAYWVGPESFRPADDVPGCPGSAARDWSDFRERMRHVIALFRSRHDAPDVFAVPSGQKSMSTTSPSAMVAVNG